MNATLSEGAAARVFTPPLDIVLLATEWQPRALIRAQLIEGGLEVVATDSWPVMRRHLRPGRKPRVAFVDLQGLVDPSRVLSELRILMRPNRVLVLTAMGAMPSADVERFGFHVIQRPIAIGDAVRIATDLARASSVATDSVQSTIKGG